VDFVLQQAEECIRISTYNEWYQAFGHVSMTSINPSYCADGHILPSPSNNFECSICELSKSTKKTPAPIAKKTKSIGELIYSDLSGKFSVPSLGKSLYYITFINDFSCFTWVEFLKHKSDTSQAIKDFIRERQH
jgi:hypothetical protein